MADSSPKHQIAIAIIGSIGVVGAAAFSNWDKIFQRQIPSSPIKANTGEGIITPGRVKRPPETNNQNIQQQNSGSGANIVATGDVSYSEAPASLADKQEEVALMLKRGMSYGEARSILLNRGWQPAYPHPTSGPPLPKDAVGVADKIVSSIFHEEGFHEVEVCSPTGFGFCRFIFSNASGQRMVIVTAVNNDGKTRSVHRWFFD